MIKITDFVKKYGQRVILKCDEICFDEGKISFIMAPNGAGKTTLLKCITALEQYDGKIEINGKINTENLRDCLVIWDDCPFFTNLSGYKNLMIMSEDKLSREEIKKTALKYVDADLLKRRVSTYSYGQKKKLALALAEILDPSVLIMDEISNGLDFDMMQWLQGRLRSKAENHTIILTGHQFGFYEKIVDDLFVIKDSEMIRTDIAEGKTLEEVYCEELH